MAKLGVLVSLKTAKDIWETAKGALQIQVSKANYDTWLKDTTGISYRDNLFVIGTPSAFATEWLDKRLKSLVKKTLIRITGENVEVHFQVHSSQSRVIDPQPVTVRNTSSVPYTTNKDLSLFRPNPKYTFDTFVVGHCNRLAYATALEVAEEPGKKYNPLFIYGGPGLGKTHLALAIGNAAAENGLKVLYTSAEQFTNEFVTSIRDKKTEEFRNKYRNVELLLLDDIHFINGKTQTQEGLFHTFNELHNAGRQVVITCDRPPTSLTSFESRLSSRFEWGIVAPVEYPDLETRRAILKAKAEQLRIRIDKAVMDLIARSCKRNVRQLEGSLNRLNAYSKLSGKSPTLELAEKALQDLSENGSNHATVQKLSPDTILDTVAGHFNLSTEAIKSSKRDKKTALARQISIYLIRERLNCPLQSIGDILGGRDHSTMLHAHKKIATQINSDAELQSEVNNIVSKLQKS